MIRLGLDQGIQPYFFRVFPCVSPSYLSYLFLLAATEFKDKFEECAKLSGNGSTDDAKKLADDLSALNVKDEKDKTEEEVKENGKSEKGKKTADSTVEALKSTTEETPKSSSDTTATETASKD